MKIVNRIIKIAKEIKLAQESRKNWEMKMNEPIVPWPLDSESRKKHIAKGNIFAAKYEFRFMFDYCAETCLWSDNDSIAFSLRDSLSVDEIELLADEITNLQGAIPCYTGGVEEMKKDICSNRRFEIWWD